MIIVYILVAVLIVFGLYKLATSEVTEEKECCPTLVTPKVMEVKVSKLPSRKSVVAKPVKKSVKKTTKK